MKRSNLQNLALQQRFICNASPNAQDSGNWHAAIAARNHNAFFSVAINSPGTDFLAIDNFIFEPVRPYAVPEPGMLALFSLGLAGIGFAGRKARIKGSTK